MAANSVEQLQLKDQLQQAMEEARVVLPGIQALFGFQLIAVFNESFSKNLDGSEQRIHLLAIALTASAAGLFMATAALHRQSQPESVSNRLVKMCTNLLTLGMMPLMFALPLDFYLLARLILKEPELAKWLAVGLWGYFACLWYVMPWAVRGRLKSPQAEPSSP